MSVGFWGFHVATHGGKLGAPLGAVLAAVGTGERERSVGVQGAGMSAPFCNHDQRVALMGQGEGVVTGGVEDASVAGAGGVIQVGAIDIQLGGLSGRGLGSLGGGGCG